MSVANPNPAAKTRALFLYCVEYTRLNRNARKSPKPKGAPKWKRTFFVDTFCHLPASHCVSPRLGLIASKSRPSGVTENVVATRLKAVFLGVMPEGTVGDFEKLRSSSADTTCFLQGGLQIHALGGGDRLLKIHALVRYFDSLAHSRSGGRSGSITQDAIWEHANGNFFAGFQGHGALHRVFQLSYVSRPLVGFEL